MDETFPSDTSKYKASKARHFWLFSETVPDLPQIDCKCGFYVIPVHTPPWRTFPADASKYRASKVQHLLLFAQTVPAFQQIDCKDGYSVIPIQVLPWGNLPANSHCSRLPRRDIFGFLLKLFHLVKFTAIFTCPAKRSSFELGGCYA